jgi:hypothetical protein
MFGGSFAVEGREMQIFGLRLPFGYGALEEMEIF